MKRQFLLNARSGRGIGPGRIEALRRWFARRGESFDVLAASSRAEGIAKVREALRGGMQQIVALGGDGTVNAAANGFFEGDRLVNPDACLAVAKFGSGFDYLRTVLRGARQRDWREIVLRHRVRRVDMGEIRFAAGSPPVRFVNNVSFGMSVAIVQRKEQLPHWIPKTLTYLAPTVQELFQYRPTTVALGLNGPVRELSLITVFIAKGNFGGRGMRFGPGLAPDDGRFEVTVFEAMTPVQMLLRMGRLYTGSFEGVTHVQKHFVHAVSVASTPPPAIEYDGELGPAENFQVRVIERALPVCFPEA